MFFYFIQAPGTFRLTGGSNGEIWDTLFAGDTVTWAKEGVPHITYNVGPSFSMECPTATSMFATISSTESNCVFADEATNIFEQDFRGLESFLPSPLLLRCSQ